MTLELGEYVLAAGAVGTAAMGIVEGFKTTRMTPPGFRLALENLEGMTTALQAAYGERYGSLIEAQFRDGRRKGDLPKTLRQGVRIGLTEDTAEALAAFVGVVNGKDLKEAATAIQKGEALTPEQRNVIGRFELAADARIDAALAIAEQAYLNGMRFWAFVVAIALSLAAAAAYAKSMGGMDWISALIVGLVAVPLAPIAKDVAKGIQAAGKAFSARK